MKMKFQSNMKLITVIQNYHWFVWIFSVFFSLAMFKKSAERHFFSLSLSDFEDGWIFDRPKDVSDTEWMVLTSTFKKFWPLLLFQVLISSFIKRTVKSVLPLFYSFYSVVCLTVILGDRVALCFLLYITVMFIAHLFGRKSICYILTFGALLLKNSTSLLDLKNLLVDDEIEYFLFEVAFTWIMAKCLSFTCDRIDLSVHDNISLKAILVVTSYCLYFPTAFTGPILSYGPFVKQMNSMDSDSPMKVVYKIRHLCYILICYVAYEILLHFVYSSSVQYYPEIVKEFNTWSLCGLGYALPMMFFFKYFIIYSLAGSISSFENIDFPPPPKCISCIHSSSYLWRHFDRGLYLWLLRYLYYPLMEGKYNLLKKIYSVAACFAFVSLWHNVDKDVCIWVCLNFLLLAYEMFIESCFSSKNVKKVLPASSFRDMYYAAATTPSFILMCISSIFFLSNYEIGVLLFERVMSTGVIPFLPVVLIMFCGCKVSINVRLWEKNRYCCNEPF